MYVENKVVKIVNFFPTETFAQRRLVRRYGILTLRPDG